ncbi:hypothetical protein E2320_002221, partial [Naja naja]
RVEEAVVEIALQVGTWPKVHAEWLGMQECYQLEEDLGCQVAFQLRYWPECLLVHLVQRAQTKSCAPHLPGHSRHNWYRMAVAMDIELHLHPKEAPDKKPKR